MQKKSKFIQACEWIDGHPWVVTAFIFTLVITLCALIEADPRVAAALAGRA